MCFYSNETLETPHLERHALAKYRGQVSAPAKQINKLVFGGLLRTGTANRVHNNGVVKGLFFELVIEATFQDNIFLSGAEFECFVVYHGRTQTNLTLVLFGVCSVSIGNS